MEHSKKIVITEGNINQKKDKFVCYGSYDPDDARCDGRFCPWSKDGSCHSHTIIRRMNKAVEEIRSNDNCVSEP